MNTLLWGNHLIVMPLTFIFSFIIAFIINKTNWIKEKTLLFYFLPAAFFFSFLLITDLIGLYRGFNPLPITFTYIVFPPIFFYLGYLFQKKVSVIHVVFVALLLLLNHYYVFPNSFAYFSFENKEVNKQMTILPLFNSEKEAVELPKDRIIVLDFWSTYCGVCYKKFPLFEDLYNKYKNNPNVEIYAVHVSFKNDKFEKVIKLLDKYNYHFPMIYALDDLLVKSELGIEVFPTVLIIKDNVIRYKGALITDTKVFFNNTIYKVESLLNE